MHPNLGQLRSLLGLYTLAEADGTLSATWPCGCSARGADMTAMEHVNCSRHERLEGDAPFPDDRRKKRET